jgi:lysophospholipase L1-like esterase
VKRTSRPGNTLPKSLLHYSRIHSAINTIQASIAKEYSCQFWNWQDTIGGPGGAYQWLQQTPALIAKDLTHLSISGYQLSARKFAADTQLFNYVHR